MDNRVLGVIGGLGPLATAHFMELVISMTEANCDQENVDMIVYNFPSIPDRTGYILGSNLKSPLPGLRNVTMELTRQNVSAIAIPCVTAHYFHGELQKLTPVPILNGIDLSVDLLKQKGIRRVGILATDGTIRCGLLSDALERAGIHPVLPSAWGQKQVMHLIYENVKAGRPVELERFYGVRQELREQGSEILLLGCTELSVIKGQHDLGDDIMDILEVMALTSVRMCEKKLKARWENWTQGGNRYDSEYSRISGSHGTSCAG